MMENPDPSPGGSEQVTTTTTELNLNGHCFICLRLLEEETGGGRISGGDGRSFFHPLLCYLTGYPHSNHQSGGGEESVEGEEEFQLATSMRDLPPVCGGCLEGLGELFRLHQQLLEIQRRIQRQTQDIRDSVSKTVEVVEEEGSNSSRRDRFIMGLESSIIPVRQVEQCADLVVKIHDRIISRGSTPVLFPPHSSPSGESDEVPIVTDPVPPQHQPISGGEPITLMDVEIEDADGSLPPKKQKVQVEFITIEEYAAGTEGDPTAAQMYVTQMEEQVEEQQGLEIPVEEEVEGGGEKNLEDSSGAELGASEADAAAVSVGGVPVDPSANYVMITTNVTDPNTGVVSLQPILISVSQLQAMQQQQTPASPPQFLPSLQPTITDNPPKKSNSSKKEHVPIFPTSSEFLYHKFHEDIQPCDVCNARIPRGSEIASHLATHVGSDYVFYCAHCQLGFISPFRLEKYHRSRPVRCPLDTSPLSPLPSFLCDQCPFQTDKMPTFKKHLDQHDSEEGRMKSFQCPLCPLRFTGRRSVEVHLGEKHVFTKPSGRQKCDICGSIFDLGEIEAHLWSHGVSEILRCKLCMCIFSSVDAMISHQTVVKRRGLHDISCHVCSSRFIRVRDLRLHYFEQHGLGNKYLCETCKEEFFTLDSFQTHQKKCGVNAEEGEEDMEEIQEIPREEEEGPQSSSKNKKGKTVTPKPVYPSMAKKECPTCGKILSTADTLLRHRIKIHAHPPLTCSRPDCHETFTSEAERRSHVAAEHQGYTLIKRPHTCDQCGEEFARKDKLRTHKFVKHSTDKPHSCHVCGLTYRNKATLQDHVNLKHLGVEKKRNKMCEVCGRGFTDSQVLKHHKLIHTNERPFSCALCGQRFRQRTAVRAHEKSHVELGAAFKPKGEMERSRKKKGD